MYCYDSGGIKLLHIKGLPLCRHFPKTMNLVTGKSCRGGSFWNLQAIQCIASGITDSTGNLPYHVQEPDPGSGGNYEKNKKKKNPELEGVSETGRNLVGKGQTGNLGIPAAVHMKLISLKKPRLTFFFSFPSFPLSPPRRGR